MKKKFFLLKYESLAGVFRNFLAYAESREEAIKMAHKALGSTNRAIHYVDEMAGAIGLDIESK